MTEETCKWGEMQNLPAAPAVPLDLAAGIAELGRLAALCPHGWVELMVEQGHSPSTPDDPGEGYQDVQAICVWGIGPDIVLAYPNPPTATTESRGTWDCVVAALKRGIWAAVWVPELAPGLLAWERGEAANARALLEVLRA